MQSAQINPTPEDQTQPVAPAEQAQPEAEVAAEAIEAVSEPTGQTALDLDQLINLCIEKSASDLHFREGGRVALRVGGKLIFVENLEPLTQKQAEAIVNLMIPSKTDREKLEKEREVDFAYAHTNGIIFRVNVFYQSGKLSGVMRMISKHIPSLEELGIPEVMKRFLNLKEGLILVCGPAGGGKSTSMHSMLEYINENFVQHVLTIENPIEYVFEDKKSMFTQREIGKDALSVEDALSSAAREDADVVMVNEVTDYKTLDRVLNLVETGHLVIAAMQTRDVTQTLERILHFYPNDLTEQAQDRLAANLTAILAQDLAERQDQEGLIAVFELMFMSESIRNSIKRGNLVQIRTAIQASQNQGMITLESYASQLAEQGVISQEQLNDYLQRGE